MKIIKNPPTYDHNTVIWEGTEGRGYIGKDDGIVCIQRCPKCGKKNYVQAISSGSCAFCNFNAN